MRRSNTQIAETLLRVRNDLEKVTSPRERKEGAYYSLLLQLSHIVSELDAPPSPKEVVAAMSAPKKRAVREEFEQGEVVVNGNLIRVDFKARKRV